MTERPADEHRTETFTGLTPGSMVQHYRIVELIGAGGMGEVYLADDTRLERRVALKFLPRHSADDPEVRARFVREARSAARLNHPNIVTIHEVGEIGGRPFIAMEYVEGETLHQAVQAGTLSIERTADLMRQCAEGLAEAHEKGVVHRDIKPGNIVIDRSGRARLLDFGLAAMPGSDRVTRPGVTLGTFAYMAPEQARGEDCDARADLFSLGVVWYELLTGVSPFARDHAAATLHAVIEHDPPPPERDGIPIPEATWVVLQRLITKDPDDRISSARELLAKLKSESSVKPVATQAQPSIAVLPLANMSEDPSQEHFCDGIAEDIINDLTRQPGLRVVARTSAFAFKGKNEDMRVIGRRLNVGAILEGSVRKAGDRIRVTAQLINVADGFHLWSERYDRRINDIFAIQDDIARNVVDKLVGILLPSESHTRARPIDFEAYELYSRGRHHLSRRNNAGFVAALECFRGAVERQPDYVRGYVGIADAHFLQYAYDLVEPRDAIARARASLLKALEIDANIAEAYATLGGILTFHDWAWSEAEEAFKKSLTLNPGYAVGHQWYGELLAICGRFDEAEAQFSRARELDPLADIVLIMHGVTLYIGGRTREGMALFEKAIAMGSQNENAFCWLGLTQLEFGMKDEAMASMRRAREVSGNSIFSTVMHGHGCALAGDKEGLSRIAEEVESRAASEYVTPALRAALRFDLGERERAYQLLNEAIRCHNSEAMIMSVAPYYAEMRTDPTVRTLLGVLGLVTP